MNETDFLVNCCITRCIVTDCNESQNIVEINTYLFQITDCVKRL